MKKSLIFLLCISLLFTSGCNKRTATNDDSLVTATPTTDSTNTMIPLTTPTTIPTIPITVTPTVDPSTVNNQTSQPNDESKTDSTLLEFQVQPIDIKTMDVPYMTKEEFPKLDGSTANIPLGEAIYTYLTNASSEEAKKDLQFYKTPESYRNLMNGYADILFVYEPSQIILQEIKDHHAELEFKPLGRDALVFIENENNPVKSLTRQQITDIYTGTFTNWSEVGGENMEVLPFQRPAESGSQTLMEKLAVPANQIMNGPLVARPAEMGDLIDVLAFYNNERNALGYSVFFYANYMYNKPGLKFVAIDGVLPTNETIQKGDYPYVNDFYVVIRKDEPKDSNARKLYEWMTSRQAQTILAQAGYVPVVDVSVKDEDKDTSHGTVITGSMDINDNQYIIMHNLGYGGSFKGDSLLDGNFNTIMTFSGKYIETGSNLLCQDDDLLVLVSSSFDHEQKAELYELYSLAEKRYLTTRTYDTIYPINDQFYLCKYYDYTKNQIDVMVVAPDYQYHTKISFDDPSNVRVIGNHILDINNDKISVIDNGKVIATSTIPYLYYDVGEEYGFWRGTYDEYLELRVYTDSNKDSWYYVIYDDMGRPIPMDNFNKNLPKHDELWIKDWVKAVDGHLCVGGCIDDQLYIVRDDGKIIYQVKAEAVYLQLNANVFNVFDHLIQSEHYMLYDGTNINPNNDIIRHTNDCIIICDTKGFTAYATNKALTYRVNDDNYDYDTIYGVEYTTYPEFTSYSLLEPEEGTYSRSSYCGIKEFCCSQQSLDDNHFIVSDRDGRYHIINRDGDIVLTAQNDDYISDGYLGNQIYAYVFSGNYEGIIDSKGNFLYRQYGQHLNDD